MKQLLGVIALLFLLPSYVLADNTAQQSYASDSQTQNAHIDPDENDLSSHNHYINKDGESVHSPAKSRTGEVPAGASAKCRDNTYSFSLHRRGTCSHHGGVATWL